MGPQQVLKEISQKAKEYVELQYQILNRKPVTFSQERGYSLSASQRADRKTAGMDQALLLP